MPSLVFILNIEYVMRPYTTLCCIVTNQHLLLFAHNGSLNNLARKLSFSHSFYFFGSDERKRVDWQPFCVGLD